ncbi:MAG: Rrf2 family transcriptional regulator [Oscillospiraceae bacterium]|nr:Rrf2 family transcriptional regulator [Oscillospiraceae bacterium]MBQ7082819.1 Rrf2 family transcriptional regulator [Oscillospiraceae bacterium]MBR2636819.1 Rrf2 family transcriptional regulator [Oscillospiraceae bacterium]MBR6608300.1 Rrf2 family transcriptional regulator [Oscillospiraceae bacterium]
MKISTKGRYGLRMMIDIAMNQQEGPVSVRDIARRQSLSDKYLEQIITQANRAGLLKSIRGAGGGYQLSRDAKDISVGDVLRAMEGSLSPVACVQELAGETAPCQNSGECATYELWRDIKAAVDAVVDNRSLQDMIDNYTRKNGDREEVAKEENCACSI